MTDTTHYDGYWADVADARDHWHVLHEFHRASGDRTITVVIAEADTGSRYTVVSTPLPWQAEPYLGGAPTLITLLSPWQAAYTLQDDGTLHIDYVREKLGRRRLGVHGGDLAAVALTVGYALRRPVDLGIA